MFAKAAGLFRAGPVARSTLYVSQALSLGPHGGSRRRHAASHAPARARGRVSSQLRLLLFVLGGRAGTVVGAKIEEDGAEEREHERASVDLGRSRVCAQVLVIVLGKLVACARQAERFYW